ncbi:MAG: hypothetical protein K9M80_00955 [Candidatus Marinimicrobia bacterium]|nr:hypothetical protein [Candidatus Neomarinimicrobiota bacterium]
MSVNNSVSIENKLIYIIIIGLIIFNNLRAADPQSISISKIEKFANSLFQQEDYLRAAIEYERYLFYADSARDTVLFKLGLSHQMRGKYHFAANNFKKILKNKDSRLYDEASMAYLYNLYKVKDWNSLKEIEYNNSKEFFFYYAAVLHDSGMKHLNWEQIDLSDNELEKYREFSSRKNKLREKSPFLAGLLSSIVPGLGKWYLQRKGDAFYSFAMTALSGAVTYRSFCKKLVLTGIVGSGITLTFYVGTIYGSIIGTKLFNEKLYYKLYRDYNELNPVKKDPYWKKWIEK